MVQKFKQFGLILGLLAVVAMGGYGDVARANSEPTAKTEVKAGAKETAKETATEAASHSGEEGGHAVRPLLDFQPAEAIWIIIIFGILVYILKKTAWKNLIDGLNAREQKIRKDIVDAESAKSKAEEAVRIYNGQLATAEQKVRDLMQGAAAEAERISTQIKMQAQQEAEAKKEQALKDIEIARKQAIQDIYAQAANLSTSIAEKILRRNLNADDQKDLVARSLEQMASNTHN